MALRGLNGSIQRMRELQSRIDALTPQVRKTRPSEILPNPRPMNGSFGQMFDGVVKPLDPMSGDLMTNITRPPSSLMSAIHSAAKDAGVDPALFEALVGRESSFNIEAESIAGAKGLAQLMPKTAASLGVTDIFNPTQNLNAGARYLGQLLRQYNGDPQLALGAYNAGPGTVKQVGGVPEESTGYVRDVLARAAAIRQIMQTENRS